MPWHQSAATRRRLVAPRPRVEGFSLQKIGIDEAGEKHPRQKGRRKGRFDVIAVQRRQPGTQRLGRRQARDVVLPAGISLDILRQPSVQITALMPRPIHQPRMMASDAKRHHPA
ncbi:hypothetical protein NFE57_16065 [Hephaestia sp. MAHUQ-44]|nr:hypothetical protein [Hephaestia sp. MAHUQ-44]MCM8732478.1 hypothetical protein [Hephaestia sp. MAHUQ-44]